MLVYFSTTIFSNLNYSPLLSGILAGVLNTAFALASYPPIYYIERVGRRAMMIWWVTRANDLAPPFNYVRFTLSTRTDCASSSIGLLLAAVSVCSFTLFSQLFRPV